MWRNESAGRVDCKGRNRGRIGRWMGFGPASHTFEDIQIIVDLECEVIPAFGAVCGAETEFVVTLLLLSGVSCSDRLEFTLISGIHEKKDAI